MANRWLELLGGVVKALAPDSATTTDTPGSTTTTGASRRSDATTIPRSGQSPTPPSSSPSSPPSSSSSSYPGDYRGAVRAEYSPNLDGDPDPGEVVWTWVPYEEDFSQGKDRPVLLIGRDPSAVTAKGEPWLLALQLTSKDHDRDAAQEARAGRYWMDVGSGPWDGKGRPSEVRLNRIIRVDPTSVRREGAIMDRALFESVAAAMGHS
jgi:hypothetical protein